MGGISIEKFFLVFLNCILLVSGQILWKIGLRNIKIAGIKSLITAFFTPNIFGGLVIYGFATLLWFYILKRYDFTKVYPLQSMSYILALFAGYFILNETITRNTILGSLIICVGIFVLSK
ncbi:EamA family transporter [Clostridium omnivorum]|uniref:Membrane protein n=1 Tax=Clostridium omnivorum TaxID=1604902 RepID=A0ABQ5N390_9CLOT|nr:EamA family transporter [Clostridium sp. E14]GLC29645.1 membrane protein [Clostridium sp. E14]